MEEHTKFTSSPISTRVSSVALSKITMLCNRYHYPVPEHFTPRKQSLCPVSSHSPFLSFPYPWEPLLRFLSRWLCPFWTFPADELTQLVALCDRVVSLSMFLRCSEALACISTSSLFEAESHPIVRTYCTLFAHSSVDGHLD